MTWQSSVFGDGLLDLEGPVPSPLTTLSITPETTYASGSRHRLDWLRRPMAPGLVGLPPGFHSCQPPPVQRTVDVMHVAVAPFQDGRDHFGCNIPQEATLTLERDGAVVGTAPTRAAQFPVPAERGDYRLTYEQSGLSPYPHRSSTTWSFRSSGDPDAAFTRLPLLTVDYGLPLDVLNRPTSRRATVTVRQVTGVDQRRIDGLRVWTSTDDGATWERSSVRRGHNGRFRVTLPEVVAGTGVSLRVDARDVTGNRIEQTLVDAYTG